MSELIQSESTLQIRPLQEDESTPFRAASSRSWSWPLRSALMPALSA